jgi:hypothetical protein
MPLEIDLGYGDAVDMGIKISSDRDRENPISKLYPVYEDGEQGTNEIEFRKSPKMPNGNLIDYTAKTWQQLKDIVSTQVSKLKTKGVSLQTFEKNTSSALFEMSSRLEVGNVKDVGLARIELGMANASIQKALEGLKRGNN